MTTKTDQFLSSLDFLDPEIMAWPIDDLALCQNDLGYNPLSNPEFPSVEGIDDAYPSCYLMESEKRYVTSSLSPEFSSATDQVISWDDNPYGIQGASSSISSIHSAGNSPQQFKPLGQCICHPALMSLLFHRKRIRHAPQDTTTLDRYRHIEGLLQWVWGLHTECSTCCDDGLVKTIWANIGNEVMCAYSKMLTPGSESHYQDS